MSYDAWLERPYQQAAASQAHFEEWCEAEDLDPSDEESRALYDEARYDAAAEAAESRAERAADRMLDDSEWRYA